MKKPIILSVLFFIITAISSFGKCLDEENIDPDTGLRTGKIEVLAEMYMKLSREPSS